MKVIGNEVYGLRCPKCRLSSNFMEFTKAVIESADRLKCNECNVDLKKDSKAKPVFLNGRCHVCNIGVAKTRKKQCAYCGGNLTFDENSEDKKETTDSSA